VTSAVKLARNVVNAQKAAQAATSAVELGEHRGVGSVDGAEKSSNLPLDFEAAKATRAANLSPALMTYYKKPVYAVKGSMQYLWDNEGKKYLDLFGGIVTVSVGHCHPKVTAALMKQAGQLWHTTNIYMHPKIHEYAQRIVEKFPEPLKNVYFVNSGSEANDMAMLMARLYTGNQEIVTFRNAYHGMSPYTMGLTAHGSWRYNLPGISSGVQQAMNPDTYRGLFGGSHCRDCPVEMSDRTCDCGPHGECAAVDPYMDQFEEVSI